MLKTWQGIVYKYDIYEFISYLVYKTGLPVRLVEKVEKKSEENMINAIHTKRQIIKRKCYLQIFI